MDYTKFKETFHLNPNKQQEEAILQAKGATLLLAVPGSGKTTTIVTRIGYLYYCCGVNPNKILTMTFTVESTKDMERSFVKRFGTDITPHFSTINSLCMSILSKCYHEKGEKPMDIISSQMHAVKYAYLDINKCFPADCVCRELLQAISYAKNMMLSESQRRIVNSFGVDFNELYKGYQQQLQKEDKIDFDDQLVHAYQFLQKYPDILEYYQDKYPYINVDEAQDVSYIQHLIIQLLASKHNNIFMVGDEDQSIYSFRAAVPQMLMQFKDMYKDARVLYMEQNYRSSGNIIRAARNITSIMGERYDKTMRTENNDGAEIKRTHFENAPMQYDYIASVVQPYTKGKQTIAILFRNNESAIPVVDTLERAKIPFKDKGEYKQFFTHPIVLDILSFLRLSMNDRDIDSFMQIYYKMKYPIKKDVAEDVLSKMQNDSTLSVWDAFHLSLPYRGEMIDEIQAKIKSLKGYGPSSVYDAIISHFDYDKFLKKNNYSPNIIRQRLYVLQVLFRTYTTTESFLKRIYQLQNDALSVKNSNIVLSTIHSSKGLEFDKVIIIDAIQGIIPASEAEQDTHDSYDEFMEDARLFYVAVTRAKCELEIITTDKRIYDYVEPSCFIKVLFGENADIHRFERVKPIKKSRKGTSTEPTDSIKTAGIKMMKGSEDYKDIKSDKDFFDNFPVGTYVKHAKFGEGWIIAYNDEYHIVQIDFIEQGVTKTLLTELCRNKCMLCKL